MKITRRTLLGTAGTLAAGALSPAQTPSPATPPPPDPNKRSADAIAKVPLPQSTEPAFSFKA